MDLKQLEYFLAVAEEKQITAAAKRLFVAQPPLSYQLKQLEKELGTKLFIRESHGVKLTDAGKELQEYAEKIVSLAQKAKGQVGKIEKGELGSIRIGSASSSVGELPSAKFEQLKQFYPDLSFDIYEDNTYGIIDGIRSGKIDLGIVRTPFDHTGFDFKELTSEKMVLVTADQNLIQRGHVSLADLAKEPLIIYRRFESIFNSSFAHMGIRPFYAVKCDDSRTAILWAKQGMGVALVPEGIASLYAKGQFLPIDHASWQTHLQLIWKKEKLSPLIVRVVDLF